MTTTTMEIPGYIAGTWNLDAARSHIGFTARHLMVSKVRGRFDTFTGTIITAAEAFLSLACAIICWRRLRNLPPCGEL